MKLRKIIALIMVFAIVFTIVGCSTPQQESTGKNGEKTEGKETLKIGWTVTDMTNPIFAAAGEEFKKICDAKNWEVTMLDAQSNASTQISQVENFISSGIDVLIIYPMDVNALEDVCARAKDAGIKVFSWDFEMKSADMSWLVYNYDLGQMIGNEAAKWANEKYPEGCEIAVLDYAVLPVIVERANGIVDAIKEKAPKCKIVAQDSAVNVSEGMNVAESMLQAHPDIKVFACIGDGGAVGANEALKASGVNLEDYGCFGADASDEALTAIKNNEAVRMSVTLGSGKEFAESISKYVEQLLSGKYEAKVYKTMTPVNASNVDKYINK